MTKAMVITKWATALGYAKWQQEVVVVLGCLKRKNEIVYAVYAGRRPNIHNRQGQA